MMLRKENFIHLLLGLLLALGAASMTCCSKEPARSSESNVQSEIPEPPFQPPSRADFVKLSRRPELILFIIIDTLRADHVGAYGSDKNLTPTLDGLAEASYTFERAIATSSWTRSSIASMFTSCYPGAIGVLDRDDVLSSDLLTLAEILKVQADYKCIGISTNGNAGAAVGFAQGFDEFKRPELTASIPNAEEDSPIFIAEGVVDEAQQILKKWHRRAGGDERPLFLFLHFTDPHSPYLPHPGLLPGEEPPGRFSGIREDLHKMDATPIEELTEDDFARIKYLYSGEVRYCDLHIGRLFQSLNDLEKVREMSSLIIVTADHGEGLWSHEERDHGRDLFEEQIHVPLMIRYPGMGKGDGMRIATPISLVDLPPTILAACGLPVPEQFMGHDLAPLIQGIDRGRAHDFIYSELLLDNNNLETMINGRRKVIRDRSVAPHRDEAFHLFDLDLDPGEQKNLLNDRGASIEWSGTIKKALRKWGDAVKSGQVQSQEIDLNDLDEETLNNLRALGYLGPVKPDN